MRAKIYVEGGGNSRFTSVECRRGFAQFFAKIVPPGCQPRVIPCGGKDDAFADFLTALVGRGNELVLLLVDADAQLAPGSVWSHLEMQNGWQKPPQADDQQAHVMTQCMESWLLADHETLSGYFGTGFRRNALPGQANIELIPKADVLRALDAASRDTRTKGQYHKTRHGFDLLGRIRADQVCQASAQAQRLRQVLQDACTRSGRRA